MDDVITNVEQATPDWLTKLLQEKGHLDQERVTTVEKKSSRQTITSITHHLELGYSADTSKRVPSRLFLKISREDLDSEISSRIGKRETEFYNIIANSMTDAPVVPCYNAAYSPETGRSHILLADLSETHFQTDWPLPPLKLYCEQVMDCLAKFHAFWWDHSQLGKSVGTLPNNESIKNYIRDMERRFAGFVNFLGDRLSADRRLLYEKILLTLPKLWEERIGEHQAEGKNLTLVHGDAHLWSFLYPHRLDRDRVYIIDWQGWRIDTATDDLAYMIALHWYPERRRSLERDLIRRYYDKLSTYGVKNYDWSQCWNDYRLSAIGNFFIPVWQWSAKLSPAIWWPHLERAILAFNDLECAELLESQG